MPSAAKLEARRRELIAAYGTATRRHNERAGIARRLIRATCNALKAEMREAREAAQAQSGQHDLFAQPPAPHTRALGAAA